MAQRTNEGEKPGVIERLHELIEEMSQDEQHSLLNELEERRSKGQREHERKSFLETVDYTTSSGTFRDYIKDISDEGVFIQTRRPFHIGEQISMIFFNPKHGKRLKIEGEIVRANDQGIGVKFNASQVQREIIQSFIELV